MKEELKKCEDVGNVAQTIRATVEWLDNTRIAHGSDNWPAFGTPLALLLDIYKTSALPRADPQLRPEDQSILLLCQALQGMAEFGMSEAGVTPNWRYGDLFQTACYVL